jgi:hypothetical protein
LRIGVRRTISIEYKNTIVFYEYAEMQEVEENCGGPDKDVREEGRIDLAEIAGKEAILRVAQYQLAQFA